MNASLLLVDDEPAIRFTVSQYLSKEGFVMRGVSSLAEARKAVSVERFDAVLLDVNLPDGNGLDFILELRKGQLDVAIVVITGVGDIPLAVEAMRRGADHFLTKPVDMAELEVFLRKSLEVGFLRRKNTVQTLLTKKTQPLIGESPAMQRITPLLNTAAENDSTVLLHGETGTGKGVYARWIHDNSRRAGMPFVRLNCSVLRGELLASELFGHVRGSFTGAVETKQGLLDAADGGTLFLDEIGEMDLAIQTQFLQVLEEKHYRRLGDIQERRSEFRLLCATNRNLMQDVQEGRFRKDLYFRIHVFPIEFPPLRERLEDLPLLVRSLLEGFGASSLQAPPHVMQLLMAYPWPGNIRELRNVLERAFLLSRGQSTLLPEHFPGLEAHLKLSPAASEKEKIQEALVRHRGSRKKAAQELGISRATLYRKLKKPR